MTVRGKRMKRNNNCRIIVWLLVLMLLLSSCTPEEKEPRGVVTVSNCKSYIVKIPEGKNVTDYFTLLGTSGTVVMHNFGNMNQDNLMGTAYYNQVAEGGWVIHGNGLFMHIPADIPSDAASLACNKFLTNQDNYMSLEEYKGYIDPKG